MKSNLRYHGPWHLEQQSESTQVIVGDHNNHAISSPLSCDRSCCLYAGLCIDIFQNAGTFSKQNTITRHSVVCDITPLQCSALHAQVQDYQQLAGRVSSYLTYCIWSGAACCDSSRLNNYCCWLSHEWRPVVRLINVIAQIKHSEMNALMSWQTYMCAFIFRIVCCVHAWSYNDSVWNAWPNVKIMEYHAAVRALQRTSKLRDTLM